MNPLAGPVFSTSVKGLKLRVSGDVIMGTVTVPPVFCAYAREGVKSGADNIIANTWFIAFPCFQSNSSASMLSLAADCRLIGDSLRLVNRSDAASDLVNMQKGLSAI